MKKFRNLPAIFTLLSGFVASVMMIVYRYSLKNFLWILVCVMVGFYLFGSLFGFILNKVYQKEEQKKEELRKQQEEQEAENSEDAEAAEKQIEKEE